MENVSRSTANGALEFTNRRLAALMLPLILEQFLVIFVGLADSLMISSVGEAAISAVSLVDSISTLIIYAFAAMASGGAVVAGQYIGRGERERSRSAGQQMMALVLLISLGITALLYCFRDGLIALLFGKIEQDVLLATNIYYNIVMASIPAIAVYNGGAALFQAMSRSDIILKASLLMNGINVAGNAILIFGLGFGVSGAAIPTLVSRYVAAGIMVGLLFQEKYELHLANLRAFRFEKRLLRNILSIAVPSGVENSMFHFGRLMLVSLVATFGTVSITANAIGNTIGNFHCFAGMGINLGLMTVISRCVGAGEYDKARYYFRKIMKASYVVMFIVNVFFLVTLPCILDIYNTSAQTAQQAGRILVMHGISAIVFWLPGFTIPAFLRAAGDARYTMVTSAGCMWLVRVLFAYVFGKFMGFGLPGIWFAHSVLDWIVRSVLFCGRYRSGRWQQKRIRD